MGDIAGYAAPIVGAMYGAPAGALVGAGLGAFKRENPGDPSQWAQMAGLGGLSGIASNIAGNQNWLTGKGLSYGVPVGQKDPYGMFKHYLTPGEGKTPWKDYFTKPSGEYESSILEKAFCGADKQLATTTYDDTYAQLLIDNPVLAATDEGRKQLMSKAMTDTSNKTGIPMGKIIAWGLGLGALEKFTSEDQDVGDKYVYDPTGEVYENILNPIPVAEGGIIGYHGGGFTGSPHTEGAFYTGEDEGEIMPKGVQNELLKYFRKCLLLVHKHIYRLRLHLLL